MSARFRFSIILLAIVAVVPLAWWWFFEASAPNTVSASLPPPMQSENALDAGPVSRGPVRVRLGQLTGTVELRHGSTGRWEPAKPGTVVEPSDGVRTGDGSSAVLLGEDTWDVKLAAGTEVGVADLEQSISRLLLESGMATATVRGQGLHTFEVRAAHSDAFAQTDGGVFTMASNGKGTVALGTQSGEVVFSGNGRVVIVRSGQQSVVTPGHGASDPITIPSSLLLKVAPQRATVNTPTVTLKGQVEVGAQVEVQGHIVAVDEHGRFEVAVPLSEGPNSLPVSAVSVGGTTAKSTSAVELDTTVKAPTIDPNLWK